MNLLRLLAALRAGDAIAAVSLMEAHVRECRDRLLKALREGAVVSVRAGRWLLGYEGTTSQSTELVIFRAIC